MTHPHPMVRKSDVADLNSRYHPWRIEKASAGNRRFDTQARNVETDEVIYRCEGWTSASRGQALNAILERRDDNEISNESLKRVSEMFLGSPKPTISVWGFRCDDCKRQARHPKPCPHCGGHVTYQVIREGR